MKKIFTFLFSLIVLQVFVLIHFPRTVQARCITAFSQQDEFAGCPNPNVNDPNANILCGTGDDRQCCTNSATECLPPPPPSEPPSIICPSSGSLPGGGPCIEDGTGDPGGSLPPANTQSLGRIGEGEGLGPFADIAASLEAAGDSLERVISAIIGIITAAAGLWFLIQLLIGGLNWLSAGGDAKSLEGARNRITNGIIGLVIVIAAWAIVGIIGTVLGLDILNPAVILTRINAGLQGSTPATTTP